MRVVSYNVNGIRAAIKKGLIEWLKDYPVDILCVQETKASSTDIDIRLFTDLGYYIAWYPAKKKDTVAWLFLVNKSRVLLFKVLDTT